MPRSKVTTDKLIVTGFSPEVSNYLPPAIAAIAAPQSEVNYLFNLFLYHHCSEYLSSMIITKQDLVGHNFHFETEHFVLCNNQRNHSPSVNVKCSMSHYNKRPLTPRGRRETIEIEVLPLHQVPNIVCIGIDVSENTLNNLPEIQTAIERELCVKLNRSREAVTYKTVIFCHQSIANQQSITDNEIITIAKNTNADFVFKNSRIQDLLAVIAEVAHTEKLQLTHEQIQQAHSPSTPRQLTPRDSSTGAPTSLPLTTTLSLNAEIELPTQNDIIYLLVNQRASENKDEWKKTKAAVIRAIAEASTVDEKCRLVAQYKTALQMHYNDNGEKGSAWCRWFNSNEPKSWRDVKEYDQNPILPPENTSQEKRTGSKCIIS